MVMHSSLKLRGINSVISRILDTVPSDGRNLTELSLVLLGWEVAQRNWDSSELDMQTVYRH
jgi:hypothetical protein